MQVITLMQTIVLGFVLAAIFSQIELNQTGIQDETGWCSQALGIPPPQELVQNSTRSAAWLSAAATSPSHTPTAAWRL